MEEAGPAAAVADCGDAAPRVAAAAAAASAGWPALAGCQLDDDWRRPARGDFSWCSCCVHAGSWACSIRGSNFSVQNRSQLVFDLRLQA